MRLFDQARLRCEVGLTFTELMVVLAIVAVLAACAVPSLKIYSQRQMLERATDRLVAEIYRVRLKALAEGRTWRVVFDPPFYELGPRAEPGSRFKLDRVSFGATTTRDHNGNPIPADGVRFEDKRLSFTAMGSCNAGTLFLKSGGRTCAISLQPACGLAVVRIFDGAWHAAR